DAVKIRSVEAPYDEGAGKNIEGPEGPLQLPSQVQFPSQANLVHRETILQCSTSQTPQYRAPARSNHRRNPEKPQAKGGPAVPSQPGQGAGSSALKQSQRRPGGSVTTWTRSWIVCP